jgi:hypothetical protein
MLRTRDDIKVQLRTRDDIKVQLRTRDDIKSVTAHAG